MAVTHPIGSVVAAVDFGRASAQAVKVAGFLSGISGARLTLVHAETMEAPPYFTKDQIEALEAQRVQLRAQAERYLSAFGRQETDVPFDVVISPHPPVEAILRESTVADLVVMGTHGRRGPARWWLGSVAERALRELNRPLMIVRATGAPPATLLERVAVHAGVRDRSGPLDWARRLAARGGGAVFDHTRADGETWAIEPGTTLLVVGVPEPRTTRWLSKYAEPWLRSTHLPIVFVPELEAGGVP